MGWLRSPYESLKVTPIQKEKAKRTEKTINLIITAIAKQRGREDIAEKNEKNLQRYQNIFNTLQEGNVKIVI